MRQRKELLLPLYGGCSGALTRLGVLVELGWLVWLHLPAAAPFLLPGGVASLLRADPSRVPGGTWGHLGHPCSPEPGSQDLTWGGGRWGGQVGVLRRPPPEEADSAALRSQPLASRLGA